MSTAVIENSIPRGKIALPPGKSEEHRALICSFLAGDGEVSPIGDSKDIKATLNAADALRNNKTTINCFESASALRFLIPVAAALGKSIKFTGEGSLLKRDVSEYLKILPEHGVKCVSTGRLPFEICGQLQSGIYKISGKVSSQYTTGLLLALPILKGDSEIYFTDPLQSKPYVDLTISVMNKFGVEVEETENGYKIKGNQKYNKCSYKVSGDWSHAAFFLSAAAIGGNLELLGLDMTSAQGDKEICSIMKKFGADIECGETVKCRYSALKGIEIDCRDIPDLVPAVAVTAAFADSKSILSGVGRLRYKESDRLEAICENLKRMGTDVKCTDECIIINPKPMHGAELMGYNDHRIVMAFSVAAMFAEGGSTITDAESIEKTYPAFFEDFNSIGGQANVINNRK